MFLWYCWHLQRSAAGVMCSNKCLESNSFISYKEQSMRSGMGVFLCYLPVLIWIDLGRRRPGGKQESLFLRLLLLNCLLLRSRLVPELTMCSL